MTCRKYRGAKLRSSSLAAVRGPRSYMSHLIVLLCEANRRFVAIRVTKKNKNNSTKKKKTSSFRKKIYSNTTAILFYAYIILEYARDRNKFQCDIWQTWFFFFFFKFYRIMMNLFLNWKKNLHQESFLIRINFFFFFLSQSTIS